MNVPSYVLGERIGLEESMTCEFKEVKGQPPVQAIGKVIDEYVVAFLNAIGGSIFWGVRDVDRRVIGVQLSDRMCDEVRQVAGQKIGAIEPAVDPNLYDLPFHQVISPENRKPVENTFVVEMSVRPVRDGDLYLTGSGEAYKRTLGGILKLNASQLRQAFLEQLERKIKAAPEHQHGNPDLDWMPSVARRASVVGPLLRGARILWVDDVPRNNLYERKMLGSLGISTDIALSTGEALFMLERIKYDLILSDMSRAGNPAAGKELLDILLGRSFSVPVIYYVDALNARQGTPRGAFAITNRPDEVLHFVFDVLERRPAEDGSHITRADSPWSSDAT